MLKRRLAHLILSIIVVLSLVTSCSGINQSAANKTQTGANASGPLDLESRSLEKALASGKPTLADFGSRTCIPCKNMKATMEELDPLYGDKVNLLIIIVDEEENQELVAHYQIMSIPTQFFFDATGKPVGMHIGEISKEAIVDQFKKMGIE